MQCSRAVALRNSADTQSFKAVQLHQLYSLRAFLSPPTRPSEEEEGLESWLIGRVRGQEDLDREWLGGMFVSVGVE